MGRSTDRHLCGPHFQRQKASRFGAERFNLPLPTHDRVVSTVCIVCTVTRTSSSRRGRVVASQALLSRIGYIAAWIFKSCGHSDHPVPRAPRSEEHTSELQSLRHLVCRLLLEK